MNYIPMFVLPVLSTLLERHVYNRVYAYLAYYNLLLDEQSGFRENRSCESVLFKLTYYFLNNIDIGSLRGMVLVDLRTAFDMVDHDLILFKLDLHGCRENEPAWFRFYLGECYQCEKYDTVLSDPLPAKILYLDFHFSSYS